MRYTKKFNYIKKIIFYIYDFQCQVCKQHTFELELHHVDKNNTNDELVNLKPLCTKCHLLVHGKILVFFYEPIGKIKIALEKLQKALIHFV